MRIGVTKRINTTLYIHSLNCLLIVLEEYWRYIMLERVKRDINNLTLFPLCGVLRWHEETRGALDLFKYMFPLRGN